VNVHLFQHGKDGMKTYDARMVPLEPIEGAPAPGRAREGA
jgi:hypothetical protein